MLSVTHHNFESGSSAKGQLHAAVDWLRPDDMNLKQKQKFWNFICFDKCFFFFLLLFQCFDLKIRCERPAMRLQTGNMAKTLAIPPPFSLPPPSAEAVRWLYSEWTGERSLLLDHAGSMSLLKASVSAGADAGGRGLTGPRR